MDSEKKVRAEGEQPPDIKPEEKNEEESKETVESAEKESRADKKRAKKLESEIEAIKKQLNKAIADSEAANDKYLRMIAEYDNFRKRSAKERESTYADAYSDAITAVLPVLDNLERAAVYTDAEAVAKGLAMTLKSFNDTFEKLGIKEIEAEGKTFDPTLHCAVMHVEDEAYGENEIIEVLQKGYMKGDKIIRYAMVKVAN